MKVKDRITLLPTQFRRVSQSNPLRRGHWVPKMGEWSLDGGYVKSEVLSYEGEVVACPIIAVVEQKFGNLPVTLTITARVGSFVETEEHEQNDYTLKRDKYEPSTTTITTTLTIPPYTRPWAVWVLAGLGQYVYEIISVTTDVEYDTGKV